eukprot:m.505286 g.505286  ORF g.505286 m.505286 type:complete len:193 (-) comp57364_c0_seq2:64-642(-)
MSTLPANIAVLCPLRDFQGSLASVTYLQIKQCVVLLCGAPTPAANPLPPTALLPPDVVDFQDLLAQKAVFDEVRARIFLQKVHLKPRVAEHEVVQIIHQKIAGSLNQGDETEWLSVPSQATTTIPKQVAFSRRPSKVEFEGIGRRVSVVRKPIADLQPTGHSYPFCCLWRFALAWPYNLFGSCTVLCCTPFF